MGILRTDPNGKPTYRRRCQGCTAVYEGERVTEILAACRKHSAESGHSGWIREDRQRDPLEGISTETMSALGAISNRAEPRDKDKPYLRSVQ